MFDVIVCHSLVFLLLQVAIEILHRAPNAITLVLVGLVHYPRVLLARYVT